MGSRSTLLLAGVAGFLAVMLGAFGAHGLEARLGAGGVATWQTATHYHLSHALALLAVGVWQQRVADGAAAGRLRAAAVALLTGIVLFSGSLYLLALDGPRWLGPVTPLGGLAFLAGWALLLDAARLWRPADPG